ncbi:MAG TPA: NAD(P)H-dependent oxidoreductase [Pyrinomonadaceae bacterium]|jgi:NAD(P)H-dependent FMN reductase|nr:NAD(P)H-dependent oxidoreductase [Pyrinomonadaceae bacterium]
MAITPKILAFAGSLREGSLNKKVLQVAAEGARAAGAEVTVADLRDFDMPIYDLDRHEKDGFPPNAVKFQDLMLAHNGLLICSPEYNGSLPGGMKNIIDWVSRKGHAEQKMYAAFTGKVAGIMSASPGSFGGLRCLSHLRGVLTIASVHIVPLELAVTFADQKFDGDTMTDEKTKKLLENLGASVADTIRKLSTE